MAAVKVIGMKTEDDYIDDSHTEYGGKWAIVSRPVWSRCVRSSSSHLSISVGNVYTVLVTAVFRQLAS